MGDNNVDKKKIQKLKDVDKYTIDELKELLGISSEPTKPDIQSVFNQLKSKLKVNNL